MRVWLYYRLSRDEDDELNSLRNQKSIIDSYALTHGHTIVGESFDDNVSGMHFDREGIEKLCEALCEIYSADHTVLHNDSVYIFEFKRLIEIMQKIKYKYFYIVFFLKRCNHHNLYTAPYH